MAIYLDNSATTRIRKEALEKYVEVSEGTYGNPSSLHKLGHEAEKVISNSRKIILSTLGDSLSTVVFTASGSEANNLAIFGRAFAKERYKNCAKIITTEGEHASVNSPLSKLSDMGFQVLKIPTVGGKIDMDALCGALDKSVILITMMMVNNETGALYDIPAVAKLARELSPEALIHIDATQSYLKIPFTKKTLGADLITLSSHKIEGPKGVGALVIDPSVIKSKGLSAMILGGGQEFGLRSGTENVPGIAAFAKAAELGKAELSDTYSALTELKEYLFKRLSGEDALSEIKAIKPVLSAPHIVNLILPGIKSETMLHYLSSLGIFVSSGSACSSNSPHSESAVTAFGYSVSDADSSIRISFGKHNTKEDVDELISALISGLSRLARMKK